MEVTINCGDNIDVIGDGDDDFDDFGDFGDNNDDFGDFGDFDGDINDQDTFGDFGDFDDAATATPITSDSPNSPNSTVPASVAAPPPVIEISKSIFEDLSTLLSDKNLSFTSPEARDGSSETSEALED